MLSILAELGACCADEESLQSSVLSLQQKKKELPLKAPADSFSRKFMIDSLKSQEITAQPVHDALINIWTSLMLMPFSLRQALEGIPSLPTP